MGRGTRIANAVSMDPIGKDHSLGLDMRRATNFRSTLSPRAVRIWPILVLAILFFYTFNTSVTAIFGRQATASTQDVYNRTLGFERIFAISFAERTDKRDGLLLASSYAGFDIEWHDAVAAQDIPRKAAPATWDFEKQMNGSLGCWRAHMNVLHTIVHQKIQTALIMEDDVDFDISIKQQLSQFSTGVRTLQNSTSSRGLKTPYGNDWDFLWLGHCKIGPSSDESRFYILEGDDTVAPIKRRNDRWMSPHIPDLLTSTEDTRVVLRASNGGLCMFAYAITYEAARKALTVISVLPRNEPVDISYRKLCQPGRLGLPFECYGTYPTLFATHRAAGPSSRDSDINPHGKDWHDEYTWDVVYSAIQNLPRLAQGLGYVQAQWSDVKKAKKHMDEKLSGIGKAIKWDLRSMKQEAVAYVNEHPWKMGIAR